MGAGAIWTSMTVESWSTLSACHADDCAREPREAGAAELSAMPRATVCGTEAAAVEESEWGGAGGEATEGGSPSASSKAESDDDDDDDGVVDAASEWLSLIASASDNGRRW